MSAAPLVQVRDLHVHFASRHGMFRAVNGVSFAIEAGVSLGLVGESGSGKSTTGRALLQLLQPTRGDVQFAGQALTGMWRRRWGRSDAWTPPLAALRRDMQLIFQDPYASLNPRMTIYDTLAEPLRIFAPQPEGRIAEHVHMLLAEVGLPARAASSYPHEFSGGQRQRIGIARAICLRPRFIVADEPLSALDVSIQAQIITLLQQLQQAWNLTFLFIGHDLAVVRLLCARIAVMMQGHIVEIGPTEALLQAPAHPYTAALLAAAPGGPAAAASAATLDIRDPPAGPAGCVYYAACPRRSARCAAEMPTLSTVVADHRVACFHPLRRLEQTEASSHPQVTMLQNLR